MKSKKAFQIVVPDGYWRNVAEHEHIVFVRSHDEDLSGCVIDNIFEIIVLSNQDYDEYDGEAIDTRMSRFHEFLDVQYLRDCRLRDVSRAEWRLNPEYDSSEEYGIATESDADEYVRVIAVRRIRLNLEDFNTRYGTERHKLSPG